MNLKIREANSNDYIEVCKLNLDVHKLHLENRPDVYLDIKNPLEKEYFDDLLDSINTKLFIVENDDNKELVAYSIIQIMTTKNPIYIQNTFIYIDDFCVKSNVKRIGIGRLLFNHIVDYAKADVETKLQTGLAAGATDSLPDITLVEDYNAQKYLTSYPGKFADLTGKVPHSDFAKYKVDAMTVDDKVYGVPFDSGVSGMFYRTDLIEQAGYKAEDLNDITWNEFIEIGKKVEEKTGKKMLAFGLDDGGLMRVMLQSAKQWYYDKDGNINLANNDVLKEAIRTYKAIVDADIIKPTSGWNEWVGAFNAGETASVITGV